MTKAYCYEEVRSNGKILFIQSIVENGWWGDAFPTYPPLDQPLPTSPNMMHFVRTFSIMRAQGVRLISIEEVRNYGKIVFFKNLVENGWKGECIPLTPPPRSAPGLYKKHQKSLAYFSHLAPFVLFY